MKQSSGNNLRLCTLIPDEPVCFLTEEPEFVMAQEVRRQPFRRFNQADLNKFLEQTADILCGNVDLSEFRAYVSALLFFKRISDVYVTPTLNCQPN